MLTPDMIVKLARETMPDSRYGGVRNKKEEYEHKYEQWCTMLGALATQFSLKDPTFNRSRFLSDCGM